MHHLCIVSAFQLLAAAILPPVSLHLTTLGTSHKWKHSAANFAQCDVPKLHLGYSMRQSVVYTDTYIYI